jgi:hypothetical protein
MHLKAKGVIEGLAPGQAAWKKEMIEKGAIRFWRDQHGGGTVDRIVAYDKDGKVVGGFNRKGVAEGSVTEGMKYVLVDYRGNYYKEINNSYKILSTRDPEEAEKFNSERDAKDVALWTRNRFKVIPWTGQQGVAEGIFDRFKKKPEEPKDPSWEKGWELCNKDPAADVGFYLRKHGAGLDRNQFIQGFNANAKSRGMRQYGDYRDDGSGVDRAHALMTYNEIMRDRGMKEGMFDSLKSKPKETIDEITAEERSMIKKHFPATNADMKLGSGEYVLPDSVKAHYKVGILTFYKRNGQLKVSLAWHRNEEDAANPKGIPLTHIDYVINSEKDLANIKDTLDGERQDMIKQEMHGKAGQDGVKESMSLIQELVSISEASAYPGGYPFNPEDPRNWAKKQAFDNRKAMKAAANAEKAARKQMFEPVKTQKPVGPSLDEVWRKIEDVVSRIFPDGDPIDYLAPWLKSRGVSELYIGDVLDKAAKKNGYEDIYDYYDSMKDLYYGDTTKG